VGACGGTHVDRTGSIGLIAGLGVERMRGGSRLTFVCGARALRALRAYRDVVSGSVRALSVLPGELPAAIVKEVFPFDETGKPKVRPVRLAKTHWAELLPGLAAGEYLARCRTLGGQ
jgi:alanyl-tRNA synthetase